MPPGRQNIKDSGELRHHHQNELNARKTRRTHKERMMKTMKERRKNNSRQFYKKKLKTCFFLFTSCIAKTIQEVFKAEYRKR